jgi:hypothetical protein
VLTDTVAFDRPVVRVTKRLIAWSSGLKTPASLFAKSR